MPILLGPDGPSLGGFVCPAVVAADELWKLGQLRPGDRVRFERRVPPKLMLPSLATPDLQIPHDDDGAVLLRRAGDVPVVYRHAGDANLLVECGPLVLDMRLRLRVQLLLTAIRAARLPGLLDLTPGIRSLQVHYDPGALSLSRLLDALLQIERELPQDDEMRVPSRRQLSVRPGARAALPTRPRDTGWAAHPGYSDLTGRALAKRPGSVRPLKNANTDRGRARGHLRRPRLR